MKLDLTKSQLKWLRILLKFDKTCEHIDSTDYSKIDRIVNKIEKLLRFSK